MMGWFLVQKIRTFEVGLLFRDGDFQKLLPPGKHLLFNPRGRLKVEVQSKRNPWFVHEQIDVLTKVAAIQAQIEVIDLKDHQRGLVWIDGRFHAIVPAGLFAYWKGHREVRVEVIDARQVRLEHPDLKAIVATSIAAKTLDVVNVRRDHAGVLFIDGRYVETLGPGPYAFWKNAAEARVVEVDLRETMVDISGQELMTADKVSLRLNAVVTYKIVDSRAVITQTDDVRQALYRDVQLVLRKIIGARDLDSFLSDKDSVASELENSVRQRAEELGLSIASVGIRDVILPGEMRDLMNKVTEAKKAAEANLIVRREETAAIRSQANTAKLLADNPTLMRLRELEVLEKIASNNKLQIVVGEKGLSDRIVNLL